MKRRKRRKHIDPRSDPRTIVKMTGKGGERRDMCRAHLTCAHSRPLSGRLKVLEWGWNGNGKLVYGISRLGEIGMPLGPSQDPTLDMALVSTVS